MDNMYPSLQFHYCQCLIRYRRRLETFILEYSLPNELSVYRGDGQLGVFLCGIQLLYDLHLGILLLSPWSLHDWDTLRHNDLLSPLAQKLVLLLLDLESRNLLCNKPEQNLYSVLINVIVN